MNSLDTEVLVVGGGAVGLALAVELGWRGRRVIVVDEGNGTIEHPRTGGISVRTMEYCRRWGIADEVRDNQFPQDYQLDNVFCTSLAGFELARAPGPSMAQTPAPPQSPERKVRCPQFWFDPMLSRAASSYDTVDVRYHTRFDQFRDTADGVAGRARDLRSGEPVEIEARYLIGCDGPASSVRTSLGIAMSGNPLLSYSINVLFRAPRLLEQAGTAQAERFILVTPNGTWGNVTVVDGREIWRLTVIGSEERLNLGGFDPVAAIRRAVGRDDADFEVLSVSPWRRTQLVADSYRSGNVFLSGDAIHTMSPTGGFGVNTGIGDAVDLGWKLDAVLAGWGGPALLDSYETERRPAGLRNASASTANFKAWSPSADLSRIGEHSPAGEAARKNVGQELLDATHAEFESLGVILGYRYEDSPICLPDGTPPPPDEYSVYVPTARPGSRAPHLWLPDGRSTIDLFGRGFTLLHPRQEGPEVTRLAEAATAAGLPFAAVPVPDAVVSAYERPYTLVRPDGHVAWRDTAVPEDAKYLLDVVRGGFPRQARG